jgi:hypothetical protein
MEEHTGKFHVFITGVHLHFHYDYVIKKKLLKKF